MKWCLIFSLTLCFCVGSAQISPEWVNFYGSTGNQIQYQVVDVCADKAGSVYLLGYQLDSLALDGELLKYNSSGIELWRNIIPGLGPYAKVKLDKQDNIYVICSMSGFSTSTDFLTLKYDSGGNFKWYAVYNGAGNTVDQPIDIAIDDSLNVYVTGSACQSPYLPGYATVKYDSNGSQKWISVYVSGNNDWPKSLCIDSYHNVYVTGSSYDPANGNMYTVKYDVNGNEAWQRRDAITASYSGGYFIESRNDFIYALGIISDNLICIKYDMNGNIIWRSVFNQQDTILSNGDIDPTAVETDRDGNMYITGTQHNGSILADIITIKLNHTGTVAWRRSYHYQKWDEASGIGIDPSGNIFVAGNSVDSTFNLKALTTIKYDNNGNEKWVTQYHGPAMYSTFNSVALSADSLGNAFVASTMAVQLESRFALLKYGSSVGTSETERESAISIFPNPFHTVATINVLPIANGSTKHSRLLSGAQLKIYNSLGALMRTEHIINLTSYVLHRNSLPDGLYFFQLHGEHGETIGAGKFVIN
jgi:hypothetical protein